MLDIVPIEHTGDIEVALSSIEGVIRKYEPLLSEEQLTALPMFAYGMAANKIAKRLPLPYAVVSSWGQDAIFMAAVSEFRQVSQNYHRHMLEVAMTAAWDTVLDVLIEPDTTPQGQRNKLDAAKFVLEQMPKSPIKHEVAGIGVNVTESTADMIARRLLDLQTEPSDVDTEYRVYAKAEDANASIATAILVDQKEGVEPLAEFAEIRQDKAITYIMHPECRYGEVNMRDERWQCHICGEWALDLVVHIRDRHALSPRRYRTMYGIPDVVKFYMGVRESTPEEVAIIDEDILALGNKSNV